MRTLALPAGARSQLYAAGYTREDFDKPVVTIAAPYMSTIMCNQKFIELATAVQGEVDCIYSLVVPFLFPLLSFVVGITGADAPYGEEYQNDLLLDLVSCLSVDRPKEYYVSVSHKHMI